MGTILQSNFSALPNGALAGNAMTAFDPTVASGTWGTLPATMPATYPGGKTWHNYYNGNTSNAAGWTVSGGRLYRNSSLPSANQDLWLPLYIPVGLVASGIRITIGFYAIASDTAPPNFRFDIVDSATTSPWMKGEVFFNDSTDLWDFTSFVEYATYSGQHAVASIDGAAHTLVYEFDMVGRRKFTLDGVDLGPQGAGSLHWYDSTTGADYVYICLTSRYPNTALAGVFGYTSVLVETVGAPPVSDFWTGFLGSHEQA